MTTSTGLIALVAVLVALAQPALASGTPKTILFLSHSAQEITMELAPLDFARLSLPTDPAKCHAASTRFGAYWSGAPFKAKINFEKYAMPPQVPTDIESDGYPVTLTPEKPGCFLPLSAQELKSIIYILQHDIVLNAWLYLEVNLQTGVATLEGTGDFDIRALAGQVIATWP